MARPKKAVKKESLGQVVRCWDSSPVLYGFDSRFDRKENPDYHQPIRLTHLGKLINDAGAELDPKDIPEHILKEAKATNLDIEYHPSTRRALSMRDAMLAAGAEDTDPDPDSRRRRPPSREVYA